MKKRKKYRLHPVDVDIMECVGMTVRALRVLKGLSRTDLAAEIGIARQSLGAIERGERNLTISTLAYIARALDVPPSALVPNYTLLDAIIGREGR